mmetsp:Transcript_28160/g.77407  ORF Transcript_28160/g.77407 Transcript_28160/m.77407 type:complete len:445 (+) Transcript_28160:185-1519(+)
MFATRRVFSAATKHASTLIVGGSAMGCSTAYHLAHQRNNNGDGIVVVERDPTYAQASAMLSAGGIRQQFSLEQNVRMSLYGIEFLRNAPERLGVDVQLQEHGYLFLASNQRGKEQMEDNHKVQCQAAASHRRQLQKDNGMDDDIQLLSSDELQAKFPWLNSSDCVLGSFGQRGEGWFDPYSLVQGLKKSCREMGVQFVTGSPVDSKRDPDTGRVLSVNVLQEGSECTQTVINYSVEKVVNAAGAHCQDLMEILASTTSSSPLIHPMPVEPRKRCIFFFHCPSAASFTAPLTVCPTSMVYFRSEGTGSNGHFLCGVSPSEEDDIAVEHKSELNTVDHEVFNDVIWPALYNRVPDYFGELKVQSAWAGLYEYNTLDQNCIIDFHPEMPNVLMVNGFSGHGLQHSPASGRAAAELLDHGRFVTLDLSIFNFERVLDGGEPVLELGIV